MESLIIIKTSSAYQSELHCLLMCEVEGGNYITEDQTMIQFGKYLERNTLFKYLNKVSFIQHPELTSSVSTLYIIPVIFSNKLGVSVKSDLIT